MVSGYSEFMSVYEIVSELADDVQSLQPWYLQKDGAR